MRSRRNFSGRLSPRFLFDLANRRREKRKALPFLRQSSALMEVWPQAKPRLLLITIRRCCRAPKDKGPTRNSTSDRVAAFTTTARVGKRFTRRGNSSWPQVKRFDSFQLAAGNPSQSAMTELPHLTPEQRQQIYEEERLRSIAPPTAAPPPIHTTGVSPPPPIYLSTTPFAASAPNQKSKVSRPVAVILTLIGIIVAARVYDVLVHPEHRREDQQKSALAPALSPSSSPSRDTRESRAMRYMSCLGFPDNIAARAWNATRGDMTKFLAMTHLAVTGELERDVPLTAREKGCLESSGL
jgi:hypothetical protein